MPTYAYGCSVCGHEIELVQKMTDAPIRECPNCDGATVYRKMSAPSFILKWGGWYADGYSHPSPKASPSIARAPSSGTSPPPS
jgi:putative FmdB family regulatory protein